MSQHHLSVPLEIKAIDAREFEGHGSTFGNIDLGGDIVIRGAFRRSLAQHKRDGGLPPMLWMHQPDAVPGVWSEMSEDDTGLRVKGELVDTQLGNELRTLLQRKAVRGLSIGYRAVDIDFDADGNRLLKEIDLWEVSLASLAMNLQARVESVKSRLSARGEYVPTEREIEQRLRNAGLSKALARRVVTTMKHDTDSGGMLDPRWDAGDVDDEARAAIDAIRNLSGAFVGAAFRR